MSVDHHPLYAIWCQMRYRCADPTHPSFHNYGARGIIVCQEWMDFDAFVRDMGPRPHGHTVDRMSNDGPYCKENCRWATRKEQNRNTRSNRIVEFKGERQCLAVWVERLGLSYGLVQQRLYYGWSPEDAFSTPPNQWDTQREGFSGARNPKAKIDEAAARAIRQDERRSAEIAIDYGISRSTVRAIITRRTWGHLS